MSCFFSHYCSSRSGKKKDPMEDLDAEILAVTEVKKNAERSSSPSDSDGAEFGGIADSDGAEDDESALENDDDDDDDNEYGLDDGDDEDYTSKSKTKKNSSRSTDKKKLDKQKKSRRRSKSADKKNASKVKYSSRSDEEADIDDDEEFQYKYDDKGFGDSADRERLLQMKEVDRELELEGRIEERNREYDIWKKKREIMAREAKSKAESNKRMSRSSGRSKPSSKSDALQALAEQKRKKSARIVDMDLSDADSEPDQSRRRDGAKEAKKNSEAVKPEKHLMKESDGPDLRYTDVVHAEAPGSRTTTPLFMRRDNLIQLSQQPYFERVVLGLYARVKSPGKENEYLLCRITSVKKGSVYSLNGDYKANWLLVLQHGGPKRSFQIFLTSGSHPTEAEFERYRYVSERDGAEVPSRSEIQKLAKLSQKALERKIKPTEEEEKNHIANVELVYPHRVNWTLKRTEAKTALDIKRQDFANAREINTDENLEKLEQEVKQLETRLARIRQLEEKYVLKAVVRNTDVFQTLAKRNMQLNSTNEILASRQARQSGNSQTNPFARVDTTGQSYFSIKSEKNLVDVKSPARNKQSVPVNDWRRCLSVWEPDTKRRKISDAAVDSLYDIELPNLDILDRASGRVMDIGVRLPAFIPPGVDAMYAKSVRSDNLPANDARIISFEDWVK